jgi:hypothetical protein
MHYEFNLVSQPKFAAHIGTVPGLALAALAVTDVEAVASAAVRG